MQAAQGLAQAVAHTHLEERPEARDPGGRADLAEGAVDPRSSTAPPRLNDADRRRGKRRVDEADADAGEDEAGQLGVVQSSSGWMPFAEQEAAADQDQPRAQEAARTRRRSASLPATGATMNDSSETGGKRRPASSGE